MYLRGTAVRIYQILTGHLNRLVGFGELDGIDQPLMSCLTVGIRHTHQIGSLQREAGETEEEQKIKKQFKKMTEEKYLKYALFKYVNN